MKVLVIMLLVSICINAQQTDLLINVDNRNAVSLNGNWQIIIDPYENGYYNYRYMPNSNGYFINRKPQNKSELIEYDFDTSPELTVPGDWNSQMAELLFYEGTVWYKKSFNFNRNIRKRVFVYFGAVNYEAIVYLNGVKLGEHVGGFTPFSFEVTDFLKEGDNFLILKVDNKRKREAVPTVNTDWWNYGGITRRVLLIEVPNTFIKDYFIQLERGSLNIVTGWIQLNGLSLEQTVLINIPEGGVAYPVSTNDNGFAKFRFEANPDLWSPDNPYLYDVEMVSETDTLIDRIGFRSLDTDNTEILLNGKQIFLRGISIHEQAPMREGRAFSSADALVLLNWAKELGCNFVRLAHYPHNEFIIREADKMGIMVWSEIPVYWTILWDNTETYKNAVDQLTDMVNRDKNRASVIMWSVANETPRGDDRLNFLTSLINITRELDPTRLVTAATELKIDGNKIIVNDSLCDYLDVLGANLYYGWYVGKPKDTPGLRWYSKFGKPLVISEFGGGAKYGYHGDEDTRWTEEYQAAIYRYHVDMLNKIPFLRGMSPWILTDFRSPRRPLPKIQDFWNRKGLISEKGDKKMAFYVLQSYYLDMVKNSVSKK
ncbi:glycoside hydrolase family 2 protein [Bacteroidota bacterium]